MKIMEKKGVKAGLVNKLNEFENLDICFGMPNERARWDRQGVSS